MRKLILFVALIVLAGSLNSCASKSKGCGLTADNQNVPTQQEVVVADASN